MSNDLSLKSNSISAAIFCVCVPALFLLVLIIPSSREIFETFTITYPYISGFVKFALLATVGELLAGALTARRFIVPYAVLTRSFVWGVFGVFITLAFKLFGSGVTDLLKNAYLPGNNSDFVRALWISVCMNFIFGPTMMGAHRIFDSWIDLRAEKLPATLSAAAKRIDWVRFITFVVAKTIPFFWIPAHTVTFLLPEQYRVIVAAFLSIALGAILALASKPSQQQSA